MQLPLFMVFTAGEKNKEKKMQLDERIGFIELFKKLAIEAYENSVRKGFWDNPTEDGTRLALMHSEISEVLEGLRKDNPPDKHVPEYKSVEVELADVIIRIMDFAAGKGHNVAPALIAKMDYNSGREHMHGKKF